MFAPRTKCKAIYVLEASMNIFSAGSNDAEMDGRRRDKIAAARLALR